MPSQMQAMREALDHLSDINDKYREHMLNQPAMKFALDFLLQGEIPEMILPSSIKGEDSLDMYAFLIATNKRMFFVGSSGVGLFSAPKAYYREFAYSTIAAIHFEKGNVLKNAKITFHIPTTSASGYVAKTVFESVKNTEDIQKFIDHIRNKIENLNSSNSEVQPPSVNGNEDFLAKLERLGNLKTQGLLTEEEFVAAKKKLLDL